MQFEFILPLLTKETIWCVFKYRVPASLSCGIPLARVGRTSGLVTQKIVMCIYATMCLCYDILRM